VSDRSAYAKAFFDLQLEFAERVGGVTGLPLERAVLQYTNFYIRFGLGGDFDPAHPGWREYAAGLGDAEDRGDWTYRYFMSRPHAVAWPPVVATFGCFAYARLGEERIRLHFHNADADGSPLANERRAERRAELAALFAHVRRAGGPPVSVVGASWLYNIEAYRRLFPTSYLATARVMTGRFQHMPLWGQFLDRRGEVRPSMAERLLERLARQSALDGLDDCFPLQVLRLEVPVRELNEFYGV
jgi:hypothetical protein